MMASRAGRMLSRRAGRPPVWAAVVVVAGRRAGVVAASAGRVGLAAAGTVTVKVAGPGWTSCWGTPLAAGVTDSAGVLTVRVAAVRVAGTANAYWLVNRSFWQHCPASPASGPPGRALGRIAVPAVPAAVGVGVRVRVI
jgi:hypothetical protein